MTENNIATPEKKEKKERPVLQFKHYQTGEIREVKEPVMFVQFSGEFITAFMTSVEHCEDLPWYRAMRAAEFEKQKAMGKNDNDAKFDAFKGIRIEFIKKYYPQYAPKPKVAKPKKPAKLDMWEL